MADARYVIDIAAEMSGAETGAQLDSLAEKLAVSGSKSEDFREAVRRVSADLDVAKASASSAAAALAVGAAEYSVLEREAVKAARAVEKAQVAGKFDPRAAQAAGQAQGALDAYTGTLRKLEAESAKATAEQGKLEKSLASVAKIGKYTDDRNARLNQQFEKLGQAANLLPGPLRNVAQGFIQSGRGAQGLSMAFGSSSAAAIIAVGTFVALAAVVAAVTVALAAGYVAAAAYAVQVADTRRAADLTREAFANLSPEASAAVDAFDTITDATGQTDKELLALTKTLTAAKVSAKDMPAALRAASLAETALGSGGASDFVERMKAGTLSVQAFAAEAEDKFGGVVARQMLGLERLGRRFSAYWSDIFVDVNVGPVLEALGVIVDMFSKANPLAQALGQLVSGAFSLVSDNALNAAYAVEAFALGFAIEMTKAYIAAKPTIKLFDSLGMSLDTAAGYGKAFAVVAIAIGVTLAVAGFVLGVVLAAVLLIPAAIFAVGYALGVLGHALYDAAVEGFKVLSALPDQMIQLGSDLIAGLVVGITGAAGWLADTVSRAVGGAIDAAKSVLGIASPSKVFAEIGGHTVAGFTGAVDAGAGEAQDSMSAMVSPSDAGAGAVQAAPAASAGGAHAGGAGKRVDLSGAMFNFYGVKDAETHGLAMISEALTRLFEDDATALGGAEMDPA